MIYGPFLLRDQVCTIVVQKEISYRPAVRLDEAGDQLRAIEAVFLSERDRMGAVFVRGLIHELDRGLPGVVE